MAPSPTTVTIVNGQPRIKCKRLRRKLTVILREKSPMKVAASSSISKVSSSWESARKTVSRPNKKAACCNELRRDSVLNSEDECGMIRTVLGSTTHACTPSAFLQCFRQLMSRVNIGFKDSLTLPNTVLFQGSDSKATRIATAFCAQLLRSRSSNVIRPRLVLPMPRRRVDYRPRPVDRTRGRLGVDSV